MEILKAKLIVEAAFASRVGYKTGADQGFYRAFANF